MSGESFVAASERVARWIAEYRERLPSLPVLPDLTPGEVLARLPDKAPESPEPLEAVLEDLDELIVPGLTHWNHPGFLAYFSSSSSDPGILAEFVAAALNVNAMLWKTAPAASELETRMVDWVRQFVGLPSVFEGVLQDTASSSSLTALLAARERAIPGTRERGLRQPDGGGRLRVYQSDQAHSSIDKAAIAAGIGLDGIRRVPSDDRFRMKPAKLLRTLEEDRAAGDNPIMVCATLGTTSTASVDPVAEIAGICAEQGVWLHVDAAYAGPAAALSELQHLFEGWELADSIVLNPHKWLTTPIDCSVLLYRDADAVRRSLNSTPAYLETDVEARNLMDYGLPLGRRFRALKLWFLFRRQGAAELRGMLRRHIKLARGFADWVETEARFELAAPPSFSTVCFRAVPPVDHRESASLADWNGWNRRLLEEVNRRGRVFLSHTELSGRFVLRLSVGSAWVRDEDIEAAETELAAVQESLKT
ncbi:MAG: pyridoxal-dependent decarboxylase [marine benthic group bacterium]|nr:pyridoxal-dependent decarboxylase [Gemmatimonadota bacterium]